MDGDSVRCEWCLAVKQLPADSNWFRTSHHSCFSLTAIVAFVVELDSKMKQVLCGGEEIDGCFRRVVVIVCGVRKRLFSMINDLPTVFEVVSDRKPTKDKPSADSGSRSRGGTKRSNDRLAKSNPRLADESYEEEEDEHSEALCGSCGGNYNADEFWIECDVCEKWFHGKCVKITPAKAKNIKQYKCPSCSFKRSRQ